MNICFPQSGDTAKRFYQYSLSLSSQCDQTMGVAEKVRKQINLWVEDLEKCADNLEKIASKLQRNRGDVAQGSSRVLAKTKGTRRKMKWLKKLEQHEEKIHSLLHSLAEEGQPEDVMERIMRSMAKEKNININVEENVHNLLFKMSRNSSSHRVNSGNKCFMLKTFVNHHLMFNAGL